MSFEEKVLNILEKIDRKLDKLLGNESSGKSEAKVTISSTTETVKPSDIVEKQEAEEKAKEKPPVEGRRVCPECGGTSFNTEEDKTQVLFQQGGIKIFAKKYICRSCGKEV
ncbi:MAG: hypothetical protein ACFFA6_06425 [Promethearchaeota archaeon]